MGLAQYAPPPRYKNEHISMWTLIPLKLMPPTRLVRYCCDVLKESFTPAGMLATGVRADESRQRSNRSMYEIIAKNKEKNIKHDYSHVEEVFRESQEFPEIFDCKYITELKAHKKSIVNPLIDWTEADIWKYIKMRHIQPCTLYEKGYARVGCIGCPMASKSRYKEFYDFPVYEKNYKKAFDRMLVYRQERGLKNRWKTAEEVFNWWMEDKNIPGQIAWDNLT